jgi:hypothetical protein
LSSFLRPVDVTHEAQASRRLNDKLAPNMPHQKARARVERIVARVSQDVAEVTRAVGLLLERQPEDASPLLVIARLALGQPTLALECMHREARTSDPWDRYTAHITAGNPAMARDIARDADIADQDPLWEPEKSLRLAFAHILCGEHDAASHILGETRNNRHVERSTHAMITGMLAFASGATAQAARDAYEDEMAQAVLDHDQDQSKYPAPTEHPLAMAEFYAFIGDADSALHSLDTAAARGLSGIARVLNSRVCAAVFENEYWRSARAGVAALTENLQFAPIVELSFEEEQLECITAGLKRGIEGIAPPQQGDWMAHALIAYQLGQPERTRDIIELHGTQSGSASRTFDAQMLLARAEIQASQPTRAIAIVTSALDDGLATGPGQLQQAKTILAEAHLLNGDGNAAEKLLEETHANPGNRSEHAILLAMFSAVTGISSPVRVLIDELALAHGEVDYSRCSAKDLSMDTGFLDTAGIRIVELFALMRASDAAVNALAHFAQRDGSREVARVLRSPHCDALSGNHSYWSRWEWKAAQSAALELLRAYNNSAASTVEQ